MKESKLDKKDFTLFYIVLFYLFLSFLLTVYGSIKVALIKENYAIGDWLINYLGGFIRRGLLGHLIYIFYKFLGLNPVWQVVFWHLFFYFLFFFYSIKIFDLKKQELWSYLLAIFSPFIFTFQIHYFRGGYRKEIILFSIFSFLVYTSLKQKKNFWISLILYLFPILILIHEIFFIFLPYFLILYNLNHEKNEFDRKLIFPILLSTISFLVSAFYPVNQEKVTILKNYIEKFVLPEGSIFHLGKSVLYELKLTWKCILKCNYFGIYFVSFTMGIFSYIPIYGKFSKIFEKKINRLFFYVSLILTFLLMIIALDWGRFIYIHFVLLFLLSFTQRQDEKINLEIKKFVLKHKILTFLFLCSYQILWFIPHCCGLRPSDYNFMSIWIKKIILSLSKFFPTG